MDVFSLLIGGFAVLFGFLTLVTRKRGAGGTLKKLAAMRERYGDKTGFLIHLLAYSVLPIVLGLLIIAVGISRAP
jgi:hypothetical protein